MRKILETRHFFLSVIKNFKCKYIPLTFILLWCSNSSFFQFRTKFTLVRGVKCFLCIMQVNFRFYFCEIANNKPDVAILMVLHLCVKYSAYRLYSFLTSYNTKDRKGKAATKIDSCLNILLELWTIFHITKQLLLLTDWFHELRKTTENTR